MYTTCSEFVVFLYWTSNSMNNLSSYRGLVDARISVSDKDLPVQPCTWVFLHNFYDQLYEDWKRKTTRVASQYLAY